MIGAPVGKVPLLSNFDFDDIYRKNSGYLGTHNKDLLKNVKIPKRKKSFAIINMQNYREGEGTHWVAVFIDPKAKVISYYDSFGIPPPIDVNRWLMGMTSDSKKPFKFYYHSTQHQDIQSVACGFFVRYFIDCMLKGMSAADFMLNELDDDLERNERIVLNKYNII